MKYSFVVEVIFCKRRGELFLSKKYADMPEPKFSVEIARRFSTIISRFNCKVPTAFARSCNKLLLHNLSLIAVAICKIYIL